MDCEWLHPERFCNEPIYCEAPQNPEDVLCPGSDDEAYHSPTGRRMRCEMQAQRFLEGKPIFLLSASLRGPFDKKSGWVNPWRSKSASRTRPTQRRQPEASKRGSTDQPNRVSSRVFNSSESPLLSPESRAAGPRTAYTHTRHMDDESFSRVREWREKLLDDLHIPTSPAQCASQPEPTSADSRVATQQTDRRRSTITLDVLEAGTSNSSAPATPSVFDKGEKWAPSGVSKRTAASQAKVERDIGSSLSTASRNRPGSGASPAVADLLPSDTVDLSQRAVTIYEQSISSRRKTHLPPAKHTEGGTVAPERTSAAGPLSTEASAKITTPGAGIIEATASSGRLKTEASPRTDGSFHYRRKGFREKPKSLVGSKLSGAVFADSGGARRIGRSDRTGPKPALLDDEARGSQGSTRTLDVVTVVKPEPIPEVGPQITEVAGWEPAEVAPHPHTFQSTTGPDAQAVDQSQCEENDTAETASQIDGPTLVTSASLTGSGRPTMPSRRHFSSEAHPQDVGSETVGFPRKLLWPRSQPTANTDSLAHLGPKQLPHPQPLEPSGLDLRRSVPPNHPVHADHGTPQVAEEIETTRALPKEQVQGFVRKGESGPGGELDRRAESTGKIAAENETKCVTEDKGTGKRDRLLADPGAASSVKSDAETGMHPASPVTEQEIQSPWAKEEQTLGHRKALDLNTSGGEDAKITDAKSGQLGATQSPWAKEAENLPVLVSGQGLSTSHADRVKLSFIAIQALEQAASQSPWARGDSQIQLPHARSFNPLSSPANSNVLPTAANAFSPSRQTGPEEDVDMCDSQLYPPQPSTPETKQSGLPTPDFTLSVKSFKDFMTPSPQPAAKRRRISPTPADDHLPSTQALVDAAISNPWTSSSSTKRQRKQKQKQGLARPRKRVSWAPLPGEQDTQQPTTSITTTDPTERPSSSSSLPARPRASSPPPSILLSASTTNLPLGSNQKFGKHFAAVVENRHRHRRTAAAAAAGTPLKEKENKKKKKKKAGVSVSVSLLPSASQQVCGSPGFEAMAEAFIRADELRMPRHQGRGQGRQAVVGLGQEQEAAQRPGGDGGGEDGEELLDGECGGMDVDVETRDGKEDDEGVEEEAEEPQVDDVSAVMQNLEDFLGSWDLDAELAKVRSEREREDRRRETVGASMAGLSGLMDVGVWD